MQTMSRRNNGRMQIALGLLAALLTTASAAAGLAIECPQGEAGPKLSLIYTPDAMSVTDGKGTVSLSASIQGDPAGIFTLYGSGPMDAMMPDAAALDECLAAKLAGQGVTAADADMLAYVSNACRLKLTPSGSVQKVQAQLTLTSIDKGKAMLFIQRQYLTPSAVTGKPLRLDEFPTSSCEVMGVP